MVALVDIKETQEDGTISTDNVVPDNPNCPIKLRSYQMETWAKVRASWMGGYDKVICQMPTGAGKTEVAARDIWETINNGQPDVIFLVHRDDLVGQTIERFAGYGIRAVAGSGDYSRWKNNKPRPKGVVVMCVQTYVRRLKKDPDAGMGAKLYVDECHWYPVGGSWTHAVELHHGHVLGLTATPWRMGITERFDPTWQDLVLGPQTNKLQEMGFLAENIVMDVSSHVQGKVLTSKMKIASAQDGYDHHATWEEEKSKGTLTTEAVSIWYARAKEQQTIVFALTVDHAYKLKDAFNIMAGAPGLKEFNQDNPVAEVIVGETPGAERRAIIKRFADKTVRVLINVDVMREGFDAPEASCIVILRHTKSVALWRQMIGRGLRPKEGGRPCLTLDFVSNHKDLGFPEDQYPWSLKPQVDGIVQGEAPVKTCCEVGGSPDCRAVNFLPTHNCKVCKAPFGKVCPTEEDGCGEWRPWSRWSGYYAKAGYRPGACDLCGEKSEELARFKRRAEREEEERKAWARQQDARRIRTWASQQMRIIRYAQQDFDEEVRRFKRAWLESQRPRPQWGWRDARNGNGVTMDFALCRVWAGKDRFRPGFTWNIMSTNMTPPSIKDNLDKVNGMLRSKAFEGKIQQSFSNIEEAQLGIEDVFSKFQVANRKMLQGVLCHTCEEIYVPFREDGPTECGRCVADKAIQEQSEIEDGEMVF